MPKQIRLCLLALLLAVLACSFPGLVEPDPGGINPTPAPTPAPGETALPPALAEPLQFHAAGFKFSYSGNNQAYCRMSADLDLTVYPDGRVQLRSTGPGVVDHYNCTLAGSDETWYLDGQLAADGTILFEGCNMGGFNAQGNMGLDAGILSGEVSCFTKNGQLSVTFTAGN